MQPQFYLDLHHDRARFLQRDAHQRRLRAEAPQRPVHGVGLRLAGGGELPLTRHVAYRNRRRTT